MRFNWYLAARVAVLVITAYVFYRGGSSSDMWVWAFLSGYVVCTFLHGKPKTPIGEQVRFPTQVTMDDGVVAYIGDRRQFTSYMGGFDFEDECVSMAAALISDGTVIAVNNLADHSYVLKAFVGKYQATKTKIPTVKDLGFLSSYGQYLNATEALKMARKNGQLLRPPTEAPGDYLICEDLWGERVRSLGVTETRQVVTPAAMQAV